MIVHETVLPSVTLVGVHTSDAVGAGALTVTVTLAVVLPPAFVAVMVYVSVPVGGATETLPVRAVLVVRLGPEIFALAPVRGVVAEVVVEYVILVLIVLLAIEECQRHWFSLLFGYW